MFDRINTDPMLDVDQLKIYPCATVPYTVIKNWYEQGKYTPYAEKKIEVNINGTIRHSTPLIEALIHYKKNIPKRRRNNRIIRDIPTSYIIGGYDKPNLRQLVQDEMKFRGLSCKCIRCREVRDQKTDISKARLDVEEYSASKGTEFFISYESPDSKVLYGFVRLRLSDSAGVEVFPELRGCALIRELHVYGKMRVVGTTKDKNTNGFSKSGDQNSESGNKSKDKKGKEVNPSDEGAIQHFGFGGKLLQAAEKIAYQRGYRAIAVIAGVGVRDYYRKKGYMDDRHYLIKKLDQSVINCTGVDVGDCFDSNKNKKGNRRFVVVVGICVVVVGVLLGWLLWV
eukprot:TRINITY_DN2906_c0_g1_i1.p1 TRINITY_DN2906_c0_g1~~TRINITY_DN2906_c0_g1_i1.p1  ORF type:complete len:388 (+),score=93.03 TRINITY_DN2906_c0_g1_i1:146-1165(+)